MPVLLEKIIPPKLVSWFKKYASKSDDKGNKGLYGLAVALVTSGLERLLAKTAFKCPQNGYQMYGIVFFACPIVLLTILNLLTVPATGNVRIWTLCENCFVKAYQRRGDVFSGFFTSIFVGLVAPSVWIFLGFMNGQHLVCWELGYQFGANVSASYLKDRGFQHLNVSQYMEKIDYAEAKSHMFAAIFLGSVAFVMFLVIVVRRSCLKPFSPEKRLPGLCFYEKKEALAAKGELNRLLVNSNEFDQLSGMAFLFNWLLIEEKIAFLKEEKKSLKDEEKQKEKEKEIEMEIREFQELQNVLKLWGAWKKEEQENKINDVSAINSLSNEVKNQYEKYKKDLLDKREKRASEAEDKLKDYKSGAQKTGKGDNEGGKNAGAECKIMDALYQSWLLCRLSEQNKLFDIDKVVESWKSHKDDIKRMVENFDALLLQNSLIDNPELRGRVVASYLVLQYKNRCEGFRHVEQIMKKFESIYPRAASSKPWQRYVNVEDKMYNHIINEYPKKFSNILASDDPVIFLSSRVTAWDPKTEENQKKSSEPEKEENRKKSSKNNYSHSWFSLVGCCSGSDQKNHEESDDDDDDQNDHDVVKTPLIK